MAVLVSESLRREQKSPTKIAEPVPSVTEESRCETALPLSRLATMPHFGSLSLQIFVIAPISSGLCLRQPHIQRVFRKTLLCFYRDATTAIRASWYYNVWEGIETQS